MTKTSQWLKCILLTGVLMLGMGITDGHALAKIKVLVFTGGHDFHPTFFNIFEHADIEYKHVEHPKANQVFTDGTAMKYDAIVLYDMWQDITEDQKRGLLKYLQAGKGLVSLHHSIANYQAWDEYLDITGTSYVTDAKGRTIRGKEYPQSTYKHDEWMNILITDQDHPITKGLGNFKIFDETYKGYYCSPDVHLLLTTDHKLNDKTIAWTKKYENNEIVYIQLGHGKEAFANPNFRHLVAQAIRWTAKRPTAQPLITSNGLSDFETEGNAVWKVEDGILSGRQGANMAPGDLFTKQSYTDFTLNLEFKVQWPANSGVWFRYQNAQTAYQADILEYKNPLCWSGSLYCPKNGPFIAMNKDASLIDKKGWNDFVITCQGDNLVITLNGKKVADVNDTTSDKGKLGLQVHAGEEFKNMLIEIRNAFVLPLE